VAEFVPRGFTVPVTRAAEPLDATPKVAEPIGATDDTAKPDDTIKVVAPIDTMTTRDVAEPVETIKIAEPPGSREAAKLRDMTGPAQLWGQPRSFGEVTKRSVASVADDWLEGLPSPPRSSKPKKKGNKGKKGKKGQTRQRAGAATTMGEAKGQAEGEVQSECEQSDDDQDGPEGEERDEAAILGASDRCKSEMKLNISVYHGPMYRVFVDTALTVSVAHLSGSSSIALPARGSTDKSPSDRRAQDKD
jgi:hypothetical protein